MKTVKCLGCGYEIECEFLEKGEVVACEECGEEMIINSVTPLKYELFDQE